MADYKNTTPPPEGETRFGATRPGLQGGFYIQSDGGAGKGTVLALDGISVAGVTTTWYLFVTSAGVLRIASTYPTDTETSGSAV